MSHCNSKHFSNMKMIRSNRFSLVVAVLAFIMLQGAGKHKLYASDIKGTVIISSPAPQDKLSGLSFLYTKPSDTNRQENRGIEVVLYIKETLENAPPEPVSNASLQQKNKTFVPHILPVTVGTTVDFPNMDNIYHNVFSLSKSNGFNLGRYASGKSQQHTFNKQGLIEVFCDIHSHMHAYILVLPNRYYTQTDVDGSFHIKDVPPGTYTLVAWHETLPEQELTITVPESGEVTITVTF